MRVKTVYHLLFCALADWNKKHKDDICRDDLDNVIMSQIHQSIKQKITFYFHRFYISASIRNFVDCKYNYLFV